MSERLVIVLHGVGARGAHLHELTGLLAGRLPGTGFACPDAPEPCDWDPATRQWFSLSESACMINYRVDDLDALVAQLEAAGIKLVGGPESHENGKFAWIMDPDGNKVELWQPMLWDEKNKVG